MHVTLSCGSLQIDFRKIDTISVGVVLRLPGMSTKQPAVAVASRSNQRSPLSHLDLPLATSIPSGIPLGVNVTKKVLKQKTGDHPSL